MSVFNGLQSRTQWTEGRNVTLSTVQMSDQKNSLTLEFTSTFGKKSRVVLDMADTVTLLSQLAIYTQDRTIQDFLKDFKNSCLTKTEPMV